MAGVFERVKNSLADAGVVPIENSTTGSILETYDSFIKSKLNITGEIYLSLHHQLAVNYGSKLSDIKTCYSHPQAFIQCRQFFIKNPKINIVNTSDTGTAGKLVAKNKLKSEAAVTSNLSAKLNGLEIGAKNIEDNDKNFTRFAIIGRNRSESGSKITLVIMLKHIPGSLYRALEPIAKRRINLTKIESRPILGSIWEYIFILDLEMEVNYSNLTGLMHDLQKVSSQVKILGVYQKGKINET